MERLNKIKRGFSLIELLIVIAIIAILIAITVFGAAGIRQSSRDAKRKSDLQTIASGLELYKSDCSLYPAALPAAGGALTANCAAITTSTYISSMPSDPVSGRLYSYTTQGNPPIGFYLCTSLEVAPSPAGNVANCGSCGSGTSCNFRITNP